MKKYVKPELFYEHFELSQHIADCGWELKHANGACKAEPDENHWGPGALDSFGTLFTSALNCDNQTDGGYQDYCYENGSDIVAIKVAVS